MEEQIELYRSHHQLHEKYVFYMIALCVSAIGFSVYCTMGKSLQYSQIPLLIAVFSWGMSIYCGLNVIKKLLHSMLENFQRFEILGRNFNPIEYQMASQVLNETAEGITKKLVHYFKWQEYLFYTGIISFISWHILQMYLTN